MADDAGEAPKEVVTPASPAAPTPARSAAAASPGPAEDGGVAKSEQKEKEGPPMFVDPTTIADAEAQLAEVKKLPFLTKTAASELRMLKKPNKVVENICTSVVMLLGVKLARDFDWADLRPNMDVKTLQPLASLDWTKLAKPTITAVHDIIFGPVFEKVNVASAAPNCYTLYRIARLVSVCHRIRSRAEQGEKVEETPVGPYDGIDVAGLSVHLAEAPVPTDALGRPLVRSLSEQCLAVLAGDAKASKGLRNLTVEQKLKLVSLHIDGRLTIVPHAFESLCEREVLGTVLHYVSVVDTRIAELIAHVQEERLARGKEPGEDMASVRQLLQEIPPRELSELRAFKMPPKVVLTVWRCLCVLWDYPQDFAPKLASQKNFPKYFAGLADQHEQGGVTDAHIAALRELVNIPDFNVETAKRTSAVAATIVRIIFIIYRESRSSGLFRPLNMARARRARVVAAVASLEKAAKHVKMTRVRTPGSPRRSPSRKSPMKDITSVSLDQARADLRKLSRNETDEFRSYVAPPPPIQHLCRAIGVLFQSRVPLIRAGEEGPHPSNGAPQISPRHNSPPRSPRRGTTPTATPPGPDTPRMSSPRRMGSPLSPSNDFAPQTRRPWLSGGAYEAPAKHAEAGLVWVPPACVRDTHFFANCVQFQPEEVSQQGLIALHSTEELDPEHIEMISKPAAVLCVWMRSLCGPARESLDARARAARMQEERPPSPPPPRESLMKPITRKNEPLGIGAVVDVRGQRGTVQFIGPTKFDTEGVWIGVALEDKVGKNDGSVNGERYFSCEPKHGIFIRPKQLDIWVPPSRRTAAEDEEVEDKKRTRQTEEERTAALGLNHAKLAANEEQTRPLPNIELMERVVCVVPDLPRLVPGVVRYKGTVLFGKGIWYGIELMEPVGRNGGTVGKQAYFVALPGRGIFLRRNRVAGENDEDTIDELEDILKEKFPETFVPYAKLRASTSTLHVVGGQKVTVTPPKTEATSPTMPTKRVTFSATSLPDQGAVNSVAAPVEDTRPGGAGVVLQEYVDFDSEEEGGAQQSGRNPLFDDD